jgi:hypothetical protein
MAHIRRHFPSHCYDSRSGRSAPCYRSVTTSTARVCELLTATAIVAGSVAADSVDTERLAARIAAIEKELNVGPIPAELTGLTVMSIGGQLLVLQPPPPAHPDPETATAPEPEATTTSRLVALARDALVDI